MLTGKRNITALALLGLLLFEGRTDVGITGYELKQRADKTLRYYWVSPAMSQVYAELTKLAALGLVEARPQADGARRTTAYVITDTGEETVRTWLTEHPADFPVHKHPVAMRLLMGHLSTPEQLVSMLETYAKQLVPRRAELQAVRDSLDATDADAAPYAAMVADWGLAYYDGEAAMVESLIRRLHDHQVLTTE